MDSGGDASRRAAAATPGKTSWHLKCTARPRFGHAFGRRDDTFFVAEPEAQIVVRFGTFVRVQGGVGYRATSVNGLSGASSSVSVQFGR